MQRYKTSERFERRLQNGNVTSLKPLIISRAGSSPADDAKCEGALPTELPG